MNPLPGRAAAPMRALPLPAMPTAVVLGCLVLASACRPTDPQAPATTTPASLAANFRCGDMLIGTTFDNTAGKVMLSWSGHRLTLPQAPSASGARYADEHGNEFWNKGDNAMLTLAGVEHPECSVTDDVSPWDQARARGVAFRGIGTEPGWWVEVDAGDAPTLRAALDYGERHIEVAQVRRDDASGGFIGKAADGTEVALETSDGECGDGMSDQSYPAHALLIVGDKAYKGCGATLNP